MSGGLTFTPPVSPFPAGTFAQTAAMIDWYGTLRGRVGYAMGPWLFYGTGGWAFAQGRGTTTSTSPFAVSSTSISQDLQGYVVGGGVEYAVNPALSLKAEYLYIDFDKKRVVTPLSTTTINQDTHLLKVGVNYRFNSF